MKSDGDQTIDEILVNQIARRGAFLTRWAVKRAAKSLSTETHSESLILQMSVQKAYELAYSELKSIGQVLNSEQGTEAVSIRAIVGAGSMNLNPAVVDLTFTSNDPAECSISIISKAKEGLLKQQTASGAAQRVVRVLLN